MARGPLSRESKMKKLLAQASQLGIDTEKLTEEIKTKGPVTTNEDLLVEAESVTYYFRTQGVGFKYIECRWCKEVFAYKHHVDSIKYCTTQCAANYLRSIGLNWTPNKPVRERWGPARPIVVPGPALQAMKENYEFLKDLAVDTDVSDSQQE